MCIFVHSVDLENELQETQPQNSTGELVSTSDLHSEVPKTENISILYLFKETFIV